MIRDARQDKFPHAYKDLPEVVSIWYILIDVLYCRFFILMGVIDM